MFADSLLNFVVQRGALFYASVATMEIRPVRISPITAPKEPDRMFASLLPKGAPFFELLLEQNEILCAMTEKLVSLIEGHEETAPNLYAVAELEK